MSHILGIPILTFLCFLPLLGTLAIAIFARNDQHERIKYIALGFSAATFLLSLLLDDRERCQTKRVM